MTACTFAGGYALLADGTVLQNMRNGKTRAVARSKDGGMTFGEMTHDAALIDPSPTG